MMQNGDNASREDDSLRLEMSRTEKNILFLSLSLSSFSRQEKRIVSMVNVEPVFPEDLERTVSIVVDDQQEIERPLLFCPRSRSRPDRISEGLAR